MSTDEFADFLYGACLRDWDAERERMQRYADRFDAADEVRIVGEETDLRLSIAGRSMKVDAGGANIPGGEFFGCPVEDSAEGVIAFSEFPAVYAGREMTGIRLRFEGGRVVDASADTNEDFLIETLDTDEGARRLGELGIGCNPGITRYMSNTLFDEKIDGTVHLALGNGMPDLGGHERVAIHWDIVKDLRLAGTRSSSTASVVQEDGRWLDLTTRELARSAGGPIVGAAHRRGHLVARLADDVPRAAVVRPRDDRLGDADERRPRRRARPAGAARHPGRHRRRAARRAADDARRRPRPGAADASIPLLHALGVLSLPAAARARRALGVFIAPYFASQRLILPELVGDDERVVAQANAVVEGAPAGDLAARPALRRRPDRAVQRADRALRRRRDVPRLVRPAAALRPAAAAAAADRRRPRACSPGSASCSATALLRVLGASRAPRERLRPDARRRADRARLRGVRPSSKVAGAFFAAFGAGAVLGSIVAIRIVGRYDPLRLGAIRFVALTLPIFALALELPVPAVMAALALSSFFGPLVNAPLIGVITTRTPEALRAKVMTAVITAAMLAGPVGMLVAGPLLESWGPRQVFLLVATGQLLATMPFAVVAFRERARDRPAGLRTAQPSGSALSPSARRRLRRPRLGRRPAGPRACGARGCRAGASPRGRGRSRGSRAPRAEKTRAPAGVS